MVIKHGKFNIVLRPVAVILLASLVGAVAWRFLSSGGSAVLDTVNANKKIESPLASGDFEQPGTPALTETEKLVARRKAVVTGSVSGDWIDRSRWADVDVDYGIERKRVHGGTQAQRITVKAVRSGSVKFCQAVRTLPDKKYRLTVWAKSDKPMQITVGLRKVMSEEYETKVEATIRNDWQKIEVDTPSSKPVAYFMLETNDVGELIIDDAMLVEI